LRLFRTQCAACHSSEPGANKIGPSLFGVYGRAYGAAPGFRYPAASRDAVVVWTDESLDKYLTDPRSVLPRGAMPYAGLRNPAQRADILAYLQSLK
jgi:cytochrome c